ncbi:hypothetical protein GCM10010389_13660 [Streptomyces echinoruber]|uniref:Uncharacterized protein n=1 Tax=Streptomyces echinoruber TaxID=68898 RepID=A0A918V805_9ACTN|nr:hypothetical protein GCM10010389_13660 [Streptomyces echinoruber]
MFRDTRPALAPVAGAARSAARATAPGTVGTRAGDGAQQVIRGAAGGAGKGTLGLLRRQGGAGAPSGEFGHPFVAPGE